MSLAHVGAECFRLRLLTGLEDDLRQLGHRHIAGVDEVGRGSLAGPVVAAAVIPDPNILVPGIADSKQVTPEARLQLAEQIRGSAAAFSVVAVEADVIDSVNILQATKRAMLEAVADLQPQPGLVLVDAVSLDLPGIPVLPLVRGDHLSYAVAAASILAKVERDRLMTDLDKRYPHYGFAGHKGYGAPFHLRALETFGPSVEHRLTFKSVLPRTGVNDTAIGGADGS